jgi:hypothetical protein
LITVCVKRISNTPNNSQNYFRGGMIHGWFIISNCHEQIDWRKLINVVLCHVTRVGNMGNLLFLSVDYTIYPDQNHNLSACQSTVQ